MVKRISEVQSTFLQVKSNKQVLVVAFTGETKTS